LKSPPLGVRWGHIRETVFTYVHVGKYFKNLLKNNRTKRVEIYMKAF
jgi:hypothetical protein